MVGAPVLIDRLVIERFTSRVMPVLRARGIHTSRSPEVFAAQLMEDRQQLWTVTCDRPQPGAVIEATAHRGALFAGDVRVIIPGETREFTGKKPVKVKAVFGDIVCGAPTDKALAVEPEPVSHTMLLITAREISLLVDVLPHKDCFYAIDIWANEFMPQRYLVQRGRYVNTSDENRFRALCLSEQMSLATHCFTCDGSGKQRCPKCKGDGTFIVECRACSGSGSYIGKYGDPMTCRACRGSGSHTYDCNPCNGSGAVDCHVCSGRAKIWAGFSATEGRYFCWKPARQGSSSIVELSPTEIVGWNFDNRTEYSLTWGATSLIAKLKLSTRGIPSQQLDAALTLHARETSRVAACLNKLLAANQTEETQPVGLRSPRAAFDRARRQVIYEFQVVKASASWARRRILPFAEGSGLAFWQGTPAGILQRFELPWQEERVVAAKESAVLVGSGIRDGTMTLKIRFPADVDLARFPAVILIKPDVPPAEVSQLRHLSRWCSPDHRGRSIFRAVALGERHEETPPEVTLLDQSILKNPRQHEAVRWGLSNAPLVLIKGPPGTGKTTVITELVRQHVRDNKRVLMCSQTHQAVRNVLERLHREGGFSMIRHGDPRNFSEIEKQYQEGGLADEYYQGVVGHTAEKLRQLHLRSVALAGMLTATGRAARSAARLQRIRHDIARQWDTGARKLDDEMAAVDAEFATAVAAAHTKETASLAEPLQREKELRRRYIAEQKRAANAGRIRDAIASRYHAKTGHTPHLVPIEKAGWPQRLRDRLIPSIFASPQILLERHAVATAECAQIEQELTAAGLALAEAENAIARIRAARAVEEKRAQQLRIASVQALSLRYCAAWWVLDLRHRRSLARSRLLQRYAAQLAAEYAIGTTDDEPSQTWNACLVRIETAQVEIAEKAKFLRRWRESLEASREGVLAVYWESIRVFFSTCVGLGSWRRLVEKGTSAVDLVIIDEAAHATLPETLIPMCYGPRALLIGDEMQLPPSPPLGLESDCAEACPARSVEAPEQPVKPVDFSVKMSACWLERSAFEWLTVTRPELPRVVLRRQFRMHPDIGDFVAAIFYREGLENGVSRESRELTFGQFVKPVCLVSTSSRSAKLRTEEIVRSVDKSGYRNTLEAELVRRILVQAQAELGETQEFGIITPYADQVSLLRQELADILAVPSRVKLAEKDIASVDSFQGSERDVIIISLVRSPASCPRCAGSGRKNGARCDTCRGRGHTGSRLDFARDLRRLNVALSRPKKMLILVGDIEALSDPRYGGRQGAEVLSRFHEYVTDRGRVVYVWEDDR